MVSRDNVQVLLETQNLTPNKVKFTLLASTQKFPYGSLNAFETCSRENVVGPMSGTVSLVATHVWGRGRLMQGMYF